MTTSPTGLTLSLLHFLGKLHGRPRRLIVQVGSVGVLAGACEAGALVFFMDAALRITGGDQPDRSIGPISWQASPPESLALAAVLILTTAGLHALTAYLTANSSLTVQATARSLVVRGMLVSRWSFQADRPEGAMLTTVTVLASAAASTTIFLIASANSMVIAVALLTSAIAITPLFTVVLIASLVPIVLALGPASRLARRRSLTALVELTELHEEIAESESMGLEIQAFNVQERQLERLDRRIAAAFRAEHAGRFSSRLAGFWFKDLALLMFIVVVLVLDQLWDLSQASAAAVIVVVIRALGYLHHSFNATRAMIEHIPSVVELEHQLRIVDDQLEPAGELPVDELGPITFREVTYSYPDGRTALRGVNLSIEPGRTTGIVGRSGAGKSTIAEMLLRLRTPTSGTIELGGVRTDAFDIADWRRRITFVPQDARIWHRTISENIEFLRPGFTQDDIERAARLAMLHDEILQLPDGYETVLGVRSRGLSGGQRQRLSIARALLSQPWLIVLDEPTSALDAHSERDLQAALSGLRGSVTMVVIAHRLSTLALCDDLIVLDAGRVVAQGERETVMRQATFFSDREGEDFMYLDGE